jgi:large subunit ribosomal protein L9
MKVVFLEDVYGVAKGGEVKEVKNGFARNYLIPKNLAVPASHDALLRVTSLAEKADTGRVKIMADMQELADSINGSEISIEMRSGSNGRLYGSVNTALIAAELSKTSEREIDRKFISINDPIRELGEFEIPVRLHPEINVSIKLSVVSEDAPEEAIEIQSEDTTEPTDTTESEPSDSSTENSNDLENESTELVEENQSESA